MFILGLWIAVGAMQLFSMLAGTPAPTWVQYWCVYIVMMLHMSINKMRDSE